MNGPLHSATVSSVIALPLVADAGAHPDDRRMEAAAVVTVLGDPALRARDPGY